MAPALPAGEAGIAAPPVSPHSHAGHSHGAHDHAHPAHARRAAPAAVRIGPSLLRLSAGARLAFAAALIVPLWIVALLVVG